MVRPLFIALLGAGPPALFLGVPIIATVKVYYIAKAEEASDIEVRGFGDPSHRYLGIWLADRPLLAESGIEIGLAVCFEVLVGKKSLVGRQRVDEGEGYRKFLVPPRLLNRYPRRRLTLSEMLMLVSQRQ